jgi:hypothetical protein
MEGITIILNENDVEQLRAKIPKDQSEIYLGFVPWQEDLELKQSVREQFNEVAGRSIIRTVWDDPEREDVRVFIEVAIMGLIDRLKWNQLAELLRGPKELGYFSFIHPEDSPPSVYFVQGNVCITVANFAREKIDVLPIALRLVKRLTKRPRVERSTIKIEPSKSSAKVGETIIIRYKLPWRIGENGFVKLYCFRGMLYLDGNRVILRGIRKGRTSVDIYTFEAGRETYYGHIDINID